MRRYFISWMIVVIVGFAVAYLASPLTIQQKYLPFLHD